MKEYVKGLLRRFRELDALFVRQAALLAELRAGLSGGGEGLACRIAYGDLLDEERRERIQRARFPFLSGDFYAADDAGFAALADADEWDAAVAGLSWPARKLTMMADQEARGFTPSSSAPWGKRDCDALRAIVRKRFIGWQRRHSEKAYLRAVAEIRAMLRGLEKGKARTAVRRGAY